MKKRVFAMILTVALCVGLMPTNVLAETGDEAGEEVITVEAEDSVAIENDDDEEIIIPEVGDETVEIKTYSGGDEIDDEEAFEGIDPDEDVLDDSENATGNVVILTDQTLQAAIYNDASYAEKLSSSSKITLSGVMPENAVVKAYPVDVEIDGIHVLAAFDITIFDDEEQEYQPQQGAIHVSIETNEIKEAIAEDAELTVYHMEDEDDTPQEVDILSADDDSVEFSADKFSIYVVGDDGTYIDAESNIEAEVYTVNFHKYVWDETDLDDTIVSTQTVAAEDVLSEPAAPEVAHHIFDGWYTSRQDEDTGEHEGFQYDFSKSVKDNLDGWDGYTPEQEDGKYYINLYSDYDQIYYVYFMSEEDPVLNDKGNYVPYVLYTGEYSEKNNQLSTWYATEIYQEVYLDTGFVVTSWYYYDDAGDRVTAQDGDEVTDNMVLYPTVEGAIWIYFDMNGAANTEVTAIDPIYVLDSATEIGSKFPADPKRAGYEFDGWYTDAACTGDPVTADSNPQDLREGNTITLYAKWTETDAAYIVNFWRQKQTSSVEAKAEDFGDYSNEYDLVLTDYIQDNEADALVTGSPVSDVMEVPSWDGWTSYDEAATDADDKYFGFEYAKTRTENELTTSDATISGDGSTIINIYYDRVTITWKFWNVQYSDRNEQNANNFYTLVGLWGAELESGEWPSVEEAGNDSNTWIWSHHQNNSNIEYRYDTSYKYIPSGDKTKTECNFYLYPVTDGGKLYVYKEVLSPVDGGFEHTDSNGTTHYYELFTTIMLNADSSYYGVSEKFDTHTAAAFINTIQYNGEWHDISTNGGTTTPQINVDDDPNQEVWLFYDLNEYDVTLYSNGATYKADTYKYSESVTPLPDEEEMMQAVEQNPNLRPAYYYEFAGWSSADGSTIQVTDPETMPGYDLTFYAIWQLKEVTVRYFSGVNDGSVTNMAGNETILATHTATEPQNPEREGYVFVGWVTDDGEFFDFNTVLYDDINLTAVWFTADTGHTLTYVVNIDGVDYEYTVATPFIEGTEELILDIEDVLEAINDDYELGLSDDELAEIASKFLCWNTDASGTGTSYYPDSEYTFGTEDAVIYAKWITEKNATLILDYNYPEGYNPSDDGNPTAENGEDPQHPQTSLTTDNLENIALEDASELAKTTITVDGKTYRFAGWATNADADEASINPNDTVAVDNLYLTRSEENILYAVWDAVDTEAEINVQKILEGREWDSDDSFVFTLWEDGAYTGRTVVITAEDSDTAFTKAFESLVYTAPGEHTYTISEVIPDPKEEGMTYDESSITVTVTVTLDEETGELSADVVYGSDEEAEAAVFTNVYDQASEKTVSRDSEAGRNGAEVKVGDEITYDISYYNHYDTEAVVTITDVLDDGLDYVSSDPEGNYDENTRTVTWTIQAKAYEAGSVSLTVKVNENALVIDEVTNTASVQIGDDQAVDTDPVVNPVDDPEDPDKEVNIGDGTETKVGDELIYTITYKNDHSTSADIIITDVLDTGLDFVYASYGSEYDAGTRTVTWTLGSVAAYAEGSVTLIVKVNETALVVDEVTNTASVQVGDDPAVDTNPVENPVEDPEDPTKSVDVGDGNEVEIGDELTYTITYKNGHSEAADVTITDVLDVGLTFVSATDGGTYDEETRTITWNIENVEAYYDEGSVSFTATVNSDAVTKDEVENTASVQIGDDPAVDTNKVENPVDDPEDSTKGVDVGSGTEVNVGDELTYTITYKNGHSTAAEVIITDKLDEGLDFVSASDGGTYDESTRTVTWTFEAEAYQEGSVTLTVTVNETALALDEVTNTASVKIGDDETVDTNPVVNPLEDPEDPTKDVDVGNGTEVTVGDSLTYTITYKNGHGEAADVIITDVLDQGLTFVSASDGGVYDEAAHAIVWTLENVEAYAEDSVTFTATVNVNAFENEVVQNTASVKVGDDPSVDTNLIENPMYDPEMPDKSANVEPDTEVKVGDTIVYEISYKNGHSTAADVTITDKLDDGLDFVYATEGGVYDETTHTVTWTIENVIAYAEGSVSLIVTVNDEAIVKDEVENTASVQIDNDAEVETNPIVIPVEEPEDPTKDVNVGNGTEVEVGDELTYTITYKNGHSEAADVTITDVLDPGLTFVSATEGGTYNERNHTITWTIENVEAYTEGSVTFTATVNSDALEIDEVTNTATVQIGDDPAVDTNEIENPVDHPEDSTKDVDVGDGTEVKVGDEMTYTITYKNGHSVAADVTITDVLDEGLDFVSASDGGTYDESTRTVTWTFVAEANASGSVSLTVKVNEDALVKDEVTNTASVKIGDDEAVDTNPIENPVDDPEEPDKKVNIGDGTETKVGDELIYTIEYKNDHSTTADVIITDVLDDGLDFIYASNEGEYDEGTHTVTWKLNSVAAYAEGSVALIVKVNETALVIDKVTNTASVQVGDDPAVETNPVENPVEDPEDPTKSVDVGDGKEIEIGDELTYTITYKNGHSTAADVVITDVLDVGLDFVSATDGGTYDEATRTITWTIENVAAYYDEGSVSFTATVNSDAVTRDEVENKASVQIGNDPAVDTNKVENPVDDPEDPTKGVDVGSGTEVEVGDELTYTITYKNGHSEAADVTITDVLDEGLDFVSASDGGTYDESTRTVTWTFESIEAYEEGSVTLTVTVNETALVTDEVTNTASVQVDGDPAVNTNLVENPLEETEEHAKYVDVGNGTEVSVGDELTYTIEYQNSHSTEAKVVITDVLDEGLDYVEGSAGENAVYDEDTRTITWTIESVEAHAEGTVSFTAIVNEQALVKDEVTNTASVQVGDNPAVDTNPIENPVEHPEDPTKDANIEPDTEVKVGDIITYTITYKNGHSTAADVTITDTLDEGLDFIYALNGGTYDETERTVTWTIEDAAPYEEGYVTLVVMVNENALVLDEVTNTASVKIDGDEEVDTNPIENPVEDPEDPTKDVNVGDGTEVKVGDELTYTITYKNGHSEAAEVTITDVLEEGLDFVSASDGGTYDEDSRTVTWTFESIEAYKEGSVTLTVTVNETALIKDEVTNTASVQVDGDPEVETNPIENPLDDPEDPTKDVNVGAGTEVSVGDELIYTIEYKNDHSTTADVLITDALDEGLDFVFASDDGTYDETTHTVTWQISGTSAYAEDSVYVVVRVNENALEIDEVTNTATVQVGDDPEVETNPIENPVEDPEDPTKDVDVENGTEVEIGEELTYTIEFKNGHSTEADVKITDVLDAGLDFVSATDGGTYDKETRTIIWTIEGVAAYTKGSVSFTATVNSDAVVKDEVDNTASVKINGDPEVETNPIENPLDDPEDPTKGVDVGSGTEVGVGEELIYVISYKNPHSSEATVTITDVLDEGLDFVSATYGGNYDEETRTVTWILEDVAAYTAGSVTLAVKVNENALVKDEVANTASVQYDHDPAVDTNPVENPVDDPEDPIKDVDVGDGTEVNVGDKLTYTISYKNGHSEAADVIITDVLDEGLTFVSAEPEDAYEYDETSHTITWTFENVEAYKEGTVTFTATVNEDAFENEEVQNTASVQIGNDPAVNTNRVENPMDDPEMPVKTANVETGSEVKVGDTVIYEISYKNGHNVAADVTITDVLDEGLDFVYATNGGVYDETTRTVTWTIENVAAYTKGSVSLMVAVNETALVKDEVENIATVQIGNDSEQETNRIIIPVEEPKDPTKDVDVSDGTIVEVGDELTYTITYKNGHSKASDVTITDVLDAGLDFESASDDGIYDEETHTVTWTIENVEAYEEGSVTLTVIVNNKALEKDEVNNTASVQIGNDQAIDTNEIKNPVIEPEYFPLDEEIVTDQDDIFDENGYVKAESVNEYDAIEIEISTTLPGVSVEAVRNGAYALTFHDQLDAELVLDEEEADFSVFIKGMSIAPQYYTITFDPDDDCTFHVDVDLTALLIEGIIEEDDLGTAAIQIFFFADLEDADINGSYTSTAWYELLDGDDLLYTSDKDVVTVYTYEIIIQKYDAAALTDDDYTGAALAGATLGLYYDSDCTKPVSRNGEPYIVTSGEDGAITFVGIAEYTYYIKELTAPDGYVLSDEVLEITVGGTEDHIFYGNFANMPEEPENPPEPVPEEPRNPKKSIGIGDGAKVSVGEELTYTITYYNHNADVATVIITDTLDYALDFVSATDGGVYDEESRTITWTIEDAPAMEEGSVSLKVKVNDIALTEDEIENTAIVKVGNEEEVDTNTVKNPTPDESEGKPGTPTGITGTNGAPKTGDTNNISLWLVLLMAGMAGVLGAARMKKRNK